MAMEATSLAGRAAGSSTKAYRAGADMISDLPPDVAKHILECLPFCDAVRTSVLSRQWRYQWKTLSKIKLDQEFFSSIKHFITGSSYNLLLPLSDITYNILLSNIGPIHTFVLSVPFWFTKDVNISQWVQYVYGKGVKEFHLINDSRYDIMRLPSCLFFCTNLTHLSLTNCYILSLPPTFSGFPFLTCLNVFMHTRLANPSNTKALEILISSSPRLQSFKLNAFRVEDLVIRAPELQELIVQGIFDNLLRIEGTANIGTLDLRVSCVLENDLSEVSQWFSCLPNIRKLVLNDFFWPAWKQVCNTRSPDLPAIKFERLKVLELLHVSFGCQYIFHIFLYLIENSPNLQRLRCNAKMRVHCCCELLRINKSSTFPSLKHVEIETLGIHNDLEVIKYLLASSPALEKMTVVLYSSPWPSGYEPEFKLNLAKKLMHFGRASTAEVIFKV